LKRRVVITGLGAITPIGLSANEFWQGLSEGKNGVGPITLFDSAPYPIKVAAEVKGFNPELFMPIKRVDRTARVSQFAIAASKMALESAKLDISHETPENIGVCIATSGNLALVADYGETINHKPLRIDPLFIGKVAPSMVPTQVGLELGVKGPNSSQNSACASGNDAIGVALSHIQLGHADVMLAGGSESGVNRVALAPLVRVGALSKETDPVKASRPFDLNRAGFVLGEGAGILILESLEHALSRGALSWLNWPEPGGLSMPLTIPRRIPLNKLQL
jgi:3-oxoacyl-[acyl-carrier-protein] synthase II